MVYSMYVFAGGLMARWERRTDLTSLVEECSNTIENDIMNSNGVVECSDSSLVLDLGQIDTTTYTFSSGSVLRNRIPFEVAGQASQGVSPVRLNASVVTSVDTSTVFDWPVRFWSIRIVGYAGDIGDSSIVRFSMPMSSQEIIQADSSGPAGN